VDTRPIPDRLNIFLVAFVSLAAVGLLWLASRATTWPATLGLGVVFSYVMLTNYALLHDATHDTLHSRPRCNNWLGWLTGVWFPVPFSMVHYTHRSHHRFNRTDAEMFDLYYPTDNLWLKYIQWYSILCGLFWPLVPLGALLVTFAPGVLRSRLLANASPSRGLYYLSRIPADVVRRTRWQTLSIITIFALLFWSLRLDAVSVVVCYACFAFNWSTRQYITHAFSPRDVVEGAFNLRHNFLMDWILLHGQWDLNHHRHPDVSWYYLPELCDADTPRRSYLQQYLRQWRGPVAATEPAPQPARDELLEVTPATFHAGT
jgi:fatty acid desaturase